jgi:hypothetical protein
VTEKHDPVDAVILAFLDYSEGAGPRPTLEHLTGTDRERAQALIAIAAAGREIDPDLSRPSIEALLADTPLVDLFPGVSSVGDDLTRVRRVLNTVDGRAQVDVDASTLTVLYSYLDLRARFLIVAATVPIVTDAVRDAVTALFEADPDTSRVGVVAAGSDELVTQVLSADDLGDTITAPDGATHVRWAPRLPLALAARRMLEQAAPEWPSFDFDRPYGGGIDLTTVAADIARDVIAREAGRSYRGDKKRAYRDLVGQEQVFADLVALVSARTRDVDLEAETARILRAAA